MQEYKNKVEAVLFTTGRFMDLDEISILSEIGSKGFLKDILENLKEDYKNRVSALELVNENNKWKLSIKKEFNYLTSKLLTDTELDKPTQETLAVIAYKEPVLQCKVIKIRGNKAYDHIKILRENEFITSEKSGRTRLLKLNSKFYDYFDIVKDKLKSKLKEIEEEPIKETNDS